MKKRCSVLAKLFALFFFFALFQCRAEQGDKIIVIIAEKGFLGEGCINQIEEFKKAGLEVTVASTIKGDCKGMFGTVIKSDILIGDVTSSDYQALSIGGGRSLWNIEALNKLVKEFNDAKKPVGAICMAPVILARNGLLKGKRATVFRSSQAIEELKTAGANYIDYPVMRDDNIITANASTAATDYARTLIAALK